MAINFRDYIATVPDFPEKGVMFRDISPLMADGKAYAAATDKIADFAKDKHVDMIVGPEARGFIVGCPVAYKLGVGFAPARKRASYHVQLFQRLMTWNMGKQPFICTRMQLNQANVFW